MSSRPWIGLPILLVGLTCLAAQDGEFTVKLDVTLVTLQAEVFDANGRPVMDLNKDDFLVYDNGQLQSLQHFEPIEAPYSVLGLFDCTGTMRDHWPFVTAATTRFVTMLRPQDRVSVAEFGTNLQTLLDWTPRNQWNSNIEIRTDSPVCADTDFFGSMAIASSRLQRISGRTGAVVFYRRPPGTHANENSCCRRASAAEVSELIGRRRFSESSADGSRREDAFLFRGDQYGSEPRRS